jgi:hypothetical protein
MIQDFTEARARFGHRARSRLAKPNAMSAPGSLQDNFIAIPHGDEVVAGNDVPSEASNEIETRRFVGTPQFGRVLG